MLSAGYATFWLGIHNVCHNVNTQNIKIESRDRPPVHLSFTPRYWSLWSPFAYCYCSSEENSFRDFTLQKLNNDFYQYKYIIIQLLCSRPRYGSVQFLFSTGKRRTFSRTVYNRQLIQFAHIHVEFVVRLRRCQNCVKVMTISMAA